MDPDKKLHDIEIRDKLVGRYNIIIAITTNQLKIRNRNSVDVYEDLKRLNLKKEYFKQIKLIDLTPNKVIELEKHIKMYNDKLNN